MDKETSALNDILGRVRAGDESAFTELSRMYSSLTESAVKRFAPSFNPDGGDSPLYGNDDLKQLADLALYRAAQTFVENYISGSGDGLLGSGENDGESALYGLADDDSAEGVCGTDGDDNGEEQNKSGGEVSRVRKGRSRGGRSVSFGSYARVCVNNALISALRKSNAEKKRQMRAREKTESGSTDPLTCIIGSENRRELMDKIMGVLSKFEKKVFNLYITGKSAHEIAEELHRDDKSVSNAIYRMKVKIKGLLKNQ